MKSAYHVLSVEYLGGYRLRLTFVDGLMVEVDLTAKLRGKVGPVFEPLRNESYFAQATVDPELGTVVWPNGADLAPDVLHEQAVALSNHEVGRSSPGSVQDAELTPMRQERRRFVPKSDIVALAAVGPHIDSEKFRSDLDQLFDLGL